MDGRRVWILSAVSGGISLGFEAVSLCVELHVLDKSYGFFALGALIELVFSLPWLILLLAAGTLLIMAAALHSLHLLLAGAIVQLAFFPCFLLIRSLLGLLFSPPFLLIPALGGVGVGVFCYERSRRSQKE